MRDWVMSATNAELDRRGRGGDGHADSGAASGGVGAGAGANGGAGSDVGDAVGDGCCMCCDPLSLLLFCVRWLSAGGHPTPGGVPIGICADSSF